ncbi:ATP-binding protein [Candidatus Electronema sp. PJ]|uniref:ATP-binding protein n=1 Tax=Candidatus Electronema sp. PJ TaxID=3401572 RepID=UPI003AA7D3A8
MRKLLWNLCSSYLLLVLLALSASFFSASFLLKPFHNEQAQQQLAAQARLFRSQLIQEATLRQAESKIGKLCAAFQAELGTRITVVLASGKVIGDSEEQPATMDNHADRPEIKAALADEIGVSLRRSYTLAKEMLYVAVPVKRAGAIWAVVRAAVPAQDVQQQRQAVLGKIALAALPALLLAAAGGLLLSWRISRPLEEIEQGVLRFTQGSWQHRIRIAGPLEITSLAASCNRMAAQLDEQTTVLKKQLDLLESTFRSMAEAVVVTDQEGRILRCNQAAGRLFGFEINRVADRDIQEIIRHADVQQFLARTLKKGRPTEEVIAVNTGQEKILSAHGTLLRSETGQIAGALLVFHDITRLKRLETMRRDFAANVSHELKTPITAIKGFVEILRDGALHEPENADRFLEIVSRNVQRLHAIIEDLLALARLEQEEEQGQIHLNWQAIKPVLENAAAVCAPAAQAKSIQLELRCAEAIKAQINSALLEQAVVNLVDNAVKYSHERSAVILQAEQRVQNGEVVLAVQDTGCGISREHHARLFERFYRVDKARSCKLGGTGLGLAIAKHIVQAHHGTITVESALGKGSIFSIRLPG